MGGILRFIARGLCGLLLLVSSACELQSSGACRLKDGSTLDTHVIFGAWRKIDGYNPTRTEKELELNFDLLYVERGNRTCGVSFINGAPQSAATFKANYTHDVNNKKLTLTATGGTVAGTQVTYSFLGECNTTQMIYQYNTGKREVFESYNRDLPPGSCDPQ
jgi:hypothetical protein